MRPEVELLARENDLLFLQSAVSLSTRARVLAHVAGETIHLSLSALEEIPAQGDGRGHWGARWHSELDRLRREQNLAAREHVYRARLDEPQAALPHFRVLLEHAPDQDERDCGRAHHRLRARSNGLPGYSGSVCDLSQTGLCLVVPQPLQLGQRLELELDPDDGFHEPIRLETEIVWCRYFEGERSYHAGGRFLTLSEENQVALARYVHFLQTGPLHALD